MRHWTRGVLAATITVAAVLTVSTSAEADKHRPVPSQGQVDAAKATAARKAGDVAALRASLAVANARLEAAAERAEIAAEAYNGAMWRLSEAKKATAAAQAQVADALARIDEQRAGIAQLVTQSYQDGTALNSVTAFLGADGPAGVMNRLGVVESAGDSMQAKFDQYSALNALARVAQAKAEDAEQDQAVLARKAAGLRDQAVTAANVAQSEAAQIGAQRAVLIKELAKAQKVSVRLATKRQRGLEQIAQEKAAAAAAQAAKAKAAAAKAKAEAAKAKDQAADTDAELSNLGQDGGWDDPGIPDAAGTTEGAAKAIKFARAQLGDPYVWAAAGPDAWDCSGLTMMAWQQGGVSLPHYSVAQYSQTRHITVGDLRPGDLVFWGSSPATIHHVAMYLGNGQIIHAPRTGQPVQINSMYYWVPPDYFGRP